MKTKFNEFNLDKNILKSLFNMGYEEPSKVQKEVIPKLIKCENIVVKSKTGSGKTASFGIPICEMINIEENCIQALIIVPTRELAIQVKDEISNIGRIKKVRCSAIFGRQPIKDQINELKQRVHVVVATPGRVIDHIKRETIDIKNLKYLIIDEADKMLNKGFIDDMEFIFKKISKQCNIGLFSATIDKDIKYVYEKHIQSPNIIEIKNDKSKDKPQIRERLINSTTIKKYDCLKNIIYYNNPKTTIIFLNTKDGVSNLYKKMKQDKFSVAQIHGDMSQEKRIFVIKDFKEGKYNVLVSTDVASRGIHIDDVSLVINYDVPKDKENYVHRIGRTGRQDKYGQAITIITEKDESVINDIQEYIGYNIENLKDLNEESIELGKRKFEEKSKNLFKTNRINKKDSKLNSEVTKIYLNAGKKKKIRVGDIVGAFSNIDGIKNEDIGVIEISDLCSYVDLLNYKGEIFLKKHKQIYIKKKPVKVKKDNTI